jgi:hypothetical protein
MSVIPETNNSGGAGSFLSCLAFLSVSACRRCSNSFGILSDLSCFLFLGAYSYSGGFRTAFFLPLPLTFENVSQFRYLGTTITNQNLNQAEIKRRLNSDNACYYTVQSLLSSRLLS